MLMIRFVFQKLSCVRSDFLDLYLCPKHQCIHHHQLKQKQMDEQETIKRHKHILNLIQMNREELLIIHLLDTII